MSKTMQEKIRLVLVVLLILLSLIPLGILSIIYLVTEGAKMIFEMLGKVIQ